MTLKEFMDRRRKARQRMIKISKEKGIVYELGDRSATFWKDGELVAQVNFRFGKELSADIFKGKKRRLRKMV